jgi:hypothetical protein
VTEEEYRDMGRHIWQSFVPESGQSDTVHEILANYIKTTLLESKDLSWLRKRSLKADIEVVLNFQEPCLKDDVFDRIEKAILDWYQKNRDPISRQLNPNLHR